MKRPNILILITDEQRFDIAGFMGNKVVKTPVMDRLAQTGVVFSNCYTPSPICVPMRQCFAAGQYPKSCGVEFYGEDLPVGYLTFARHFSKYAYMTTACGKLHNMGQDTNGGWMRRVGMDHQVSFSHVSDIIPEELAKYQARNTKKWSDAQEIKHAGIGKGPTTGIWDEYAINGFEHVVREYFVDSYYDRAISHYPHMLYLGLNNPHYPYLADEEKFNYYLNRVEVYENQTPFEHEILGKSPFMANAVEIGDNADVTRREAQRATAAYYANIESCDEKFGRALKVLEDAGENLDEWIIIVTSDHGEMLGEHAVWEKQSFFEGSVKVPMIIRYPKKIKGGQIINENVNSIDIFATLCELAELEIPSSIDSRSLVSLMQGEKSNWENITYSEFNGDRLMIKKDNFKYLFYGEKVPEVLFDLAEDKGELKNLINDKKYIKEINEFRKDIRRLKFEMEASCKK